MIKQVCVILCCLALGNFFVDFTGVPIPGSIVGMLLLTLGLECRLIKECWVERISNFLLSNMGLFFVPPGVALMNYFGLIKAEIIPIIVATLASILLVMLTTSWAHMALRRFASFSKRERREGQA